MVKETLRESGNISGNGQETYRRDLKIDPSEYLVFTYAYFWNKRANYK